MKSLEMPVTEPATDVVVTRTVRAPRALVFAAWTDAQHVGQWFSPLGFTTPRCELDVQPGGSLLIVMRSPDGTDYPLHGTYRIVQAPELLVYSEDVSEHPEAWHDMVRSLMAKHGALHPPSNPLVTVTFEAVGETTRLTIRTRFESAAEAAAYGEMRMVEGWQHCLDKLDDLATAGRQLRVERWLDAPRALVFEAFTQPHHLARWWGPTGFTVSTYAHGAAPGAVWRYTMHGPDGVDYPNYVRYDEVVAPTRMVYAQGTDEGPAWFHVTVTFAEHEGRTLVVMRSVFDSADLLEHVKTNYGAEEGGHQTLGRLADHLGARQQAKSTFELPNDLEIVMRHTFKAPRALVYAATTQAEHIARWWGPRALELVTCELDYRVGGHYRYVQRAPDGSTFGFRGEFLAIEPEHRVVQTFIFEPMPEHVATVTVVLEEVDGHTTLVETIRHASKAARDGHFSGMESGASESMERLDELLEALAEEVVITRTFDAPRAQIWACFTEAQHLVRWWGPPGMAMEIKHLDLQPGGTMRFELQGSEGEPMRAQWRIRAIQAPERLEVLLSFCDADGLIIQPPGETTWPLRILNHIELEAVGAQTRVVMRLQAFGGTPTERATLVANAASLQQGFGASFDQLDVLLAQD